MNTLDREEIRREIEVMQSSPEREVVARAAITLAGSGDPEAMQTLREQMSRNEFLARLDDLENPQTSLVNLVSVFSALQENASQVTGEVCVALANEPEFVAEPARLNYLLPALAAVKPMTKAAADVFRRTNPEGFFSVNAPLLAENSSPEALAVFQEIIETPDIDAPNKVYVLHFSVVSRRTTLALLETCARLIDSDLGHDVRMGIIESIFDYQERPWYGNIRQPPRPPAWESATDETLQFALDLARRTVSRADLRAGLDAAIADSVSTISRILAVRAQ